MNKQTINVTGMTCKHCKANVENNIKTLPYIEDVVVDLTDKSVTLTGKNIQLQEVKNLINDLGYKAL